VTTILVVEDDQDIRFLLSETVSDLGYDVLEAADGGSGFRRAIEEHPDVILLDVMMPVMDGFQVLAKLKEHAETHPMPVIMVSARGQEQDIMRAMRGGAWGFVIKPWNQDDLESKINNAVEEVLQERGEL
jgi:DNA-binding response OmpR family regulator